MTDKLIDSFADLCLHRFEEIPGSPHTRWVPWDELRPKCTARFIAEHERQHRAFMIAYTAEHAAYVRRYVYVARRKARARKGRR